MFKLGENNWDIKQFILYTNLILLNPFQFKFFWNQFSWWLFLREVIQDIQDKIWIIWGHIQSLKILFVSGYLSKMNKV